MNLDDTDLARQAGGAGMTRPTLDDFLGATCIALLMWGLPWLAAIAQEVLR